MTKIIKFASNKKYYLNNLKIYVYTNRMKRYILSTRRFKLNFSLYIMSSINIMLLSVNLLFP